MKGLERYGREKISSKCRGDEKGWGRGDRRKVNWWLKEVEEVTYLCYKFRWNGDTGKGENKESNEGDGTDVGNRKKEV